MLALDDIKVWVPSGMCFRDNQVDIQVTGFLWNSQIEAVSALLGRGSGSCEMYADLKGKGDAMASPFFSEFFL